MNALLVVSSYHHHNTKKIAGVIAGVLDAPMKTPRQADTEALRDYDLVGFGSGIDSDRHYAELLDLVDSLPRVAGTKAFIFSTCGMPVVVAGKHAVAAYAAKSHAALREKLASRGYTVVGEFGCAGHNTNSFLKAFGGVNKGRPDAGDLADAEEFARVLKKKLES
jgi:flavodoxin